MTMQSGEMAALGERVAQAEGEGSVSGERYGEVWGGCSPFIGVGGAPGRGGRGGTGSATPEARKVGRAESEEKEFLN